LSQGNSSLFIAVYRDNPKYIKRKDTFIDSSKGNVDCDPLPGRQAQLLVHSWMRIDSNQNDVFWSWELRRKNELRIS